MKINQDLEKAILSTVYKTENGKGECVKETTS